MIETDRLYLKEPWNVSAEAVCRYYLENRVFLREYEPERAPAFYTASFHDGVLKSETEAWNRKRSFRFYIVTKEAPDRIVGTIGLNEVFFGAFHSCFLGYRLDAVHRNRGYMTEAVRRIVQFGFDEVGLHRIEGNVMPKNGASAAVLEKCGFVREGLSRKYLRINGVWEDHVHYVILNDNLE